MNNGVTPNSNGFTQPAYAAPNMFQYLTLNAMMKKDSGSYPSSSSKVSIVKYDDHFKEKGWCVKNLKHPNGQPFTKDQVAENPPLALKFGDCPVVIPIPSYKAMCTTTDKLLAELMEGSYNGASKEEKKEHAETLSKGLVKKFMLECDHGEDALEEACLPGGMVEELTSHTRGEGLADAHAGRVPHLRALMDRYTQPPASGSP